MLTSVVTRMMVCGSVAAVVMSLLFLVGRQIRRYDVVDVGWGLSFIAIALCGFMLQNDSWFQWDPQALVTIVIILWGGRLAWHIAQRIRHTQHEDVRYLDLRKKWKGSVAVNTYLRVYLVQAVLALLVSIPVVHISLRPDMAWSVWVYAGFGMWLMGFICEVVADRQLAQFMKNPVNRGKLMTEGLWKYARYPNYFGELTMWWGIAVIALGTPHGWVGIGGAALITYLIIYISGIPPKEARLRKKEGWQSYANSTRSMIPLPR